LTKLSKQPTYAIFFHLQALIFLAGGTEAWEKGDLKSLTCSSTDRSAHPVKITTPTQHRPKPTFTLDSTFVIHISVAPKIWESRIAAAGTVHMLHTKFQSTADQGGGGEKQIRQQSVLKRKTKESHLQNKTRDRLLYYYPTPLQAFQNTKKTTSIKQQVPTIPNSRLRTSTKLPCTEKTYFSKRTNDGEGAITKHTIRTRNLWSILLPLTALKAQTSQHKAARGNRNSATKFCKRKNKYTDRKTQRFLIRLCNSPGHEITAEREAEKTRGDTRERERETKREARNSRTL
jgi:hypothetical protein